MRASIGNNQTVLSRALRSSYSSVLPVGKSVEGVSRPVQSTSDNEELKNKLRNFQEENLKLQAVITDLTQVNKRWQKYNNDRQIYVQKLLNTIQDQQEQLNKMGEQRAFPTSEGQTVSSTSDSKKTALEHEISQLKEVERRLKEKIEILEFQVKANRDDWEAEHSERKQALKEKEEIEKRVNLLMSELQELKQSVIEKRLPKDFFTICQLCHSKFLYNSSNQISDDNYPGHSKLYRTAVHLPCSSQQWNEKVSSRISSKISNNELVVDAHEEKENTLHEHCDGISSEKKLKNSDFLDNNKKTKDEYSDSLLAYESNLDNDTKTITNIWNIGRSASTSDSSLKLDNDVSYSRASTVPLVNSPAFKEMITQSNTSSASSIALTASSLQEEPVQYQFSTNGGATVTSFMQIPIVKSSSAPDGKSENLTKSFRSSLDSFNMASPSAPVAFINNAENCLDPLKKRFDSPSDEGVETLTRENICCPNCNTIFPPKMHIEFLDHFDSCQRINL